jgi:bacillithiol biosynthesis deacetylase BshB1
MKLDILAFGAHPDDVELSAAGTLINQIKLGHKCGIIDLTQGELGTRGTAETRREEATLASKIMGVEIRENLKMADGFFANDEAHQRKIIQMIRKYQPEIILCNAIDDRHIDHGRAAKLVSESAFLAGLMKIETDLNGQPQKAWRPKVVYHYIQDRFLHPNFVVDITDSFDQKMEAILAYKTQFYQPGSTEPQTAISTKEFLEFLKGRFAEMGRPSGFQYAEGFTVERYPGVKDLYSLK